MTMVPDNAEQHATIGEAGLTANAEPAAPFGRTAVGTVA